MTFKKVLTPMQAAELANDAVKGKWTRKQLAKKYGVSVNTVYRYLKLDRQEPEPRKLHPCGTIGAYRRHIKNKEVPCDHCAKANRDYQYENQDKWPSTRRKTNRRAKKRMVA